MKYKFFKGSFKLKSSQNLYKNVLVKIFRDNDMLWSENEDECPMGGGVAGEGLTKFCQLGGGEKGEPCTSPNISLLLSQAIP